MANVLEKVLRIGEGRTLRRLKAYASAINDLEDDFASLTDEELQDETKELRERYANGETLDDLLPEAFAAVREAAKRTLGMRHFDVQLMGGAALHLGNIAEMKTGEGKTLVATTAAYLNAIPSRGVHVITVNDFLASYQSELMGRVFRALGMTTGCIIANQTPGRASRAVRRRHHLRHEQRVRLRLPARQHGVAGLRHGAARPLLRRSSTRSTRSSSTRPARRSSSPVRPRARPTGGSPSSPRSPSASPPGEDYEVDEKKRTVGVLEPGIEKVEDYLGIDNLYESANTPLISFLNNSIKADALFKRDKDYVVMNGEVLIVDEHTGRILMGRRYNEGIHQAIEAKEGVEVKAENQTLATVTLQNYFRLYQKLSGMTGTAETEAAEFMSTYKLGVVADPDEQADAAHRPDRPRLQEREGEVRAGRRGHRGAPREGPARPRRHHERREVRVPLEAPRQEGRQARGPQREEPRA